MHVIKEEALLEAALRKHLDQNVNLRKLARLY